MAAQLALTLQAEGMQVGLLDADIYGPSMPSLFGLQYTRYHGSRERDGTPYPSHGIKLMSMGFLTGDQPAVLRGPIIANYIQQILLLNPLGRP